MHFSSLKKILFVEWSSSSKMDLNMEIIMSKIQACFGKSFVKGKQIWCFDLKSCVAQLRIWFCLISQSKLVVNEIDKL